jgi:hypothetical protein
MAGGQQAPLKGGVGEDRAELGDAGYQQPVPAEVLEVGGRAAQLVGLTGDDVDD